MIRTFLKNQDGSTAIEYGLIAAMIAVVIVGGITSVGSTTGETFQTTADAFASE